MLCGGANEQEVVEGGLKMFLWQREASDIRGRERWAQGKTEGDFHGTVEG